MAGLILDAQLHALARHLTKVDHRVDVEKEIKYLQDRYGLVSDDQFPDFRNELHSLYIFERDRKLSGLNQLGYARFKLDQLTGNASFESQDAELEGQLRVMKPQA